MIHKEIKLEEIKIVLSALTTREDKLKEKASKVNALLEERCRDSDMNLLSHYNITKFYLLLDGIHLNWKGNYQIIKNFEDFISNSTPNTIVTV